MFYREDEFEDILQTVVLVPYSPGYKLGDFDCGTEDYNQLYNYYFNKITSIPSFGVNKRGPNIRTP